MTFRSYARNLSKDGLVETSEGGIRKPLKVRATDAGRAAVKALGPVEFPWAHRA